MIINAGSRTGSVIQASYTGAYAGGGTVYPYTAPYALVDSNSLFNGQVYEDGSEFRIVSGPSNGTLDASGAESGSLWGNDVADIYTPTAGYTGDDPVTLEVKYVDGTTAQWVATIAVGEAVADTTGPVIGSVSVPTAGTYAAGQALNFTVNWNETAVVTGTPAINLNVGGSVRQANYASGSGTNSSVFSYTVQSGDEDTNGVTVTNLALDGGTIKDAAGNGASLTLNNVGDTSAVLVDGTVTPTTSTISMSLDNIPNGTYETIILDSADNKVLFWGDLVWSGESSNRTLDIVTGSSVIYFAIGATKGGLQRGVTA